MRWETYHTKNITDKYLFRFLTIKNLKRFLNTGSIWFARADTFGDKMECVKISELKKDKPNFKAIESRKKQFLICCWNHGNRESLALWDAYPNKDGERRAVAIRFNKNLLVHLVKNNQPHNDVFPISTKWVHGKISYKNLLNVNLNALNKSIVKYTAFRKECAFRYEKEYRFVINLAEPTNKEGIAYNLGKIDEIPFHIFVNPLLEKDEYNSLRKEIKDLGFRANLRTSLLARWFRPEIWPTIKH